MRLNLIFMLMVWLIVSVSKVNAQPNWKINPQDYEFSMTITGKVTTDGYFSVDDNDMLAAFVNGVCRGFVPLKYENFENGFFSYLMVYSNSPGEEITFRIYDASENLVVETKNKLNFVINSIVGSLDEPYVFSSRSLSETAEMMNFSIPYQIGETLAENDTFFLKSNSVSLNAITATFETSPGAKAYVGDIEQFSSITVNDFTEPIEYTIISADFSDTSSYLVHIEIDENDAPANITLTNEIISKTAEVNTIIATLQAEDPDNGDTHVFSLVEGNGTNNSENIYFSIDENRLILAKPLDSETMEVMNILIRATDRQGAFIEKEFKLSVNISNKPPQFTSTPSSYVLQNDIFIYSIAVNDNEGDDIAITVEELPEWLTYNSLTKLISGTPGNNETGDHRFRIKATDGYTESVQLVIFSVINVNDPPEINFFISDQYFISDRDNEIQLPVTCIIDPDIDDLLNFTLSTENNSALPQWLSFDPQTLVISGKPPVGYQDKISLKLTANDGGNLKQWLVFNLEVNLPTSVKDLPANQIFKFYPNPVHDKLTIEIPAKGEMVQVSIHNLSGQIIKEIVLNDGGAREIKFAEKPGIYFIRFSQGEEQQVNKIIKMEY